MSSKTHHLKQTYIRKDLSVPFFNGSSMWSGPDKQRAEELNSRLLEEDKLETDFDVSVDGLTLTLTISCKDEELFKELSSLDVGFNSDETDLDSVEFLVCSEDEEGNICEEFFLNWEKEEDNS